jgi:uncharacterized protein YqeY
LDSEQHEPVVIKEQVEKDLKQAMLAGDKDLVSVIRGIKSTILNAEIASGARAEGLDEQSVMALLQKEVKKRADAAKLYEKAGERERADKEKYEQDVLSRYLPEMMSEEALGELIDTIIKEMGGEITKQQMGQVIGQAKQKSEGRAEGSMIARLVQARIG